MMSRESLYLKLPVLLQNAACTLEGWRIQRSRYGGQFRCLLAEAESRCTWTAEQVQSYRDARLRSFIRHCAANVPYYRDWFRRNGASPEDIRSLSDLQYLPVLTKQQVQASCGDFFSESVPIGERVIVHTSGTTGGGLRFVSTRVAGQEQWAVWWRYRRWHGIQPGTWCGYFGGRSVVPITQSGPPFWRYNYPGRQILFSAYHVGPDNLKHYVDLLRRRQPPWLHGYPSLLALLAAYVVDRGIDVGYAVRWVTTGAENLLPQQAELIERAFGVRPRQHYGMAEAVANFSECVHGRLHVDEDFAAVEFVPDPSGYGFRVVGTNFTNPATPLVRYDIGDIVELADSNCTCGLPGRVVSRIDGRQEDYVILRNGARLGRMDHIFKDMINVHEAQIYQQRPGEITIRIVRGTRYGQADEDLLIAETRKRVGEDTNIRVEYVEHLQRSRTGKLRFVVSEIADGKLEAMSSRGS